MRIRRVIFVCNYAANYGGNFLASLKSLAERLLNENINPIFIFPNKAKAKNWEVDLDKFEIHYTEFDLPSLKNCLISILNDGDIIHSHFATRSDLVAIRRAAKTKNVKIIHHLHMFIEPGRNLLKYWIGCIYYRFISRGSFFIAVSPETYKRGSQRFGKKNMYMVRNAIDILRLSPQNVKYAVRNSILIFGTFFYEKGVDLAISAVDSISYSNSLKLDIVSNDVHDTESKIKETFGEIPAFVRIIPAVKNINLLYQTHFLFLAPSRVEAFSYSAVEAAYCGLQVIASDIPGQNTLKDIPGIEWIKPNKASYLKTAIERQYANCDNNYNCLSKRQKYIRDHYSLHSWVEGVLNVYKDISK